MTTSTASILDAFTLDGERLELAARIGENVLVLAGPGAGKTHLLVAHACLLVTRAEGRVVLLTYSKKAALEMERRAHAVLGEGNRQLLVPRTIHGHALELLRAHGHRLALPADLEPLETKDLQALADQVAARDGVASVEDFADRFQKYQRLRGNMRASNLPPLVGAVDQEMRSTGRLDWDSCIRIATELLATNGDIRESVLHHDRNLLLDEAQDCDAGQLAFLEQLIGAPPGERHFFVVMDPDQSLYSFRQANPELVLDWATRYVADPAAITQNRRCAPRIQALARHVLEKEWSGPAIPGSATVYGATDYLSEAAWVVSEVKRRLGAGTEPRRIAVLGRRRKRLADVEAALAREVPIRHDPREQWTPPEERILATIAFIRDWNEDAFLSDVVTTFLIEVAGMSVEAARDLESECLRTGRHPAEVLSTGYWQAFVAWLDTSRRSPAEIVTHLATLQGSDASDVASLAATATRARNLSEVLRTVRAGPDPSAAPAANSVLVTTFHGAKGLEFDVVFVVGCEDGVIPDFRARTSRELRDERRALYVAITRASSEILLTWVTVARNRAQKLSPLLPPPASELWMHEAASS